MSGNYLIKRRDYADIAKLINEPGVMEQLLEEPGTVISETLTAAMATGVKEWLQFGGRIVQATLKARLFKELGRQFKAWRDKGKLDPDFAERPEGFQSWVELMSVIDEERPDVERLEALKAMFFAVNKVGVSDGQRVAAYQLFQVAKRLNSGELMVLKAAYEMRDTYRTTAGASSGGYRNWSEAIAKQLGHNVTGLVDMHDAKLRELSLLTQRQHSDQSGVDGRNARLTDLGIKFCQNLEVYSLESVD